MTEHPLVSALARAHSLLDELGDAAGWSATDGELATSVVSATRLEARVAELALRLVAEADGRDLGSRLGATDTRTWWARATAQTVRDAARRTALARALARDPSLRAALADGVIGEDQAWAVVQAVEAIPPRVPAATRSLAATELLALAAHHDAAALRLLGRRILDVVAPEVAEEQEARTLEREERHARQACRLAMTDDGHGLVHGRFTLPALHGTMLRKALLAFAAPRHQAAKSRPGERRPVPERLGPERLGQAFAEYVERYPADRLPHAGGLAATVVVTMDHHQLEDDLRARGVVTLDTGVRLSAGEARRLACGARIVPIVLGGRSQPLDVGRSRRFHTPAQRLAIAVRDQTCTAEGCDWPPGLCQVHHDVSWSKGGRTDVSSGRLLCPTHHAMAHQPRRQLRTVPNGRLVFGRT